MPAWTRHAPNRKSVSPDSATPTRALTPLPPAVNHGSKRSEVLPRLSSTRPNLLKSSTVPKRLCYPFVSLENHIQAAAARARRQYTTQTSHATAAAVPTIITIMALGRAILSLRWAVRTRAVAGLLLVSHRGRATVSHLTLLLVGGRRATIAWMETAIISIAALVVPALVVVALVCAGLLVGLLGLCRLAVGRGLIVLVHCDGGDWIV